MFNRVLILILFGCFQLGVRSQYVPLNSELRLDSIIYADLYTAEQDLVDSCLRSFDEEELDSLKLLKLHYLIENSLSDEVWTFYNRQLNTLVNNKLKQNLGVKEERFYKILLAECLNNYGVEYNAKGDVALAISYHQRSLKIREKLKYKPGIANSYANIARVHLWQDNFTSAQKFFDLSLGLYLEIKDTLNIAKSYNYLGYLAKLKRDEKTALDYYFQGLKLREKINNQNGIAQSLTYIGEMFEDKNDLDSALYYYNKGLKIDYEIGEQNGTVIGHQRIGRIYMKKSNLDSAEYHLLKSLQVSETIGYAGHIRENSRLLSDLYTKKREWEKALNLLKRYIKMADSLENKNIKKALIQQELEFNYDRKKLADSLRFKEKERIKSLQIKSQKATMKVQRTQLYLSIMALVLLVFLAIYIYRNLRNQKNANEIIESQKLKVEEKQLQILDSIAYAKRIQSAILPPMALIKENLPNSFIVYKPKDIVAGDFYWMEEKDGKVLFAAADCTGHGVPGAMVSVICNNGLNRSVREHGLSDPGEILNKTREIVISEFEKSEEEVKDGMDVALCSLDGNRLSYAGANNPLWIIRKGSEEVEEIKADKQPIGKAEEFKPFTTHEVLLNEGDSIYIFSDGFADQFGGDKGKKMKSKNFKKLLLSVQNEPIPTQKRMIDEAFKKWKGEHEQLDDVCVIGVRI